MFVSEVSFCPWPCSNLGRTIAPSQLIPRSDEFRVRACVVKKSGISLGRLDGVRPVVSESSNAIVIPANVAMAVRSGIEDYACQHTERESTEMLVT